jgi:hypothetical protein
MSYSKTNIQVNKIKQLIDLNGDKTNFDLTFNVKSINKEPFEAIVVSQSQLDSGIDFEYKKVNNGIISGNIINDKNVYQNYFLLLKSENPTECEIEITIKEIEPKMIIPPIVDQYENKVLKMNETTGITGLNWKNILIGVIVIFGIILLYYFYSQSSKTVATVNTTNDFGDSDNIISINDVAPTNEILNIDNIIDSSDSVSILDNNLKIENNFNENLFNKLNNVKMW